MFYDVRPFSIVFILQCGRTFAGICILWDERRWSMRIAYPIFYANLNAKNAREFCFDEFMNEIESVSRNSTKSFLALNEMVWNHFWIEFTIDMTASAEVSQFSTRELIKLFRRCESMYTSYTLSVQRHFCRLLCGFITLDVAKGN